MVKATVMSDATTADPGEHTPEETSPVERESESGLTKFGAPHSVRGVQPDLKDPSPVWLLEPGR